LVWRMIPYFCNLLDLWPIITETQGRVTHKEYWPSKETVSSQTFFAAFFMLF
jgi:hypothetical protein